MVKFFLHVSKNEQRKRLLSGSTSPEKNWKFNADDIEERGFWDDYMEAYEDVPDRDEHQDAPWYIVPADDKLNTRLFVAKAIVDALKPLDVDYPKLDAGRLRELRTMRRLLTADR